MNAVNAKTIRNEDIVRRLVLGETLTVVARRYGITPERVRQIRNRSTRAWLRTKRRTTR